MSDIYLVFSLKAEMDPIWVVFPNKPLFRQKIINQVRNVIVVSHIDPPLYFDYRN